MEEEKAEIVFKVPDKKAKGYARRAHRALQFQKELRSGVADPDLMVKLVEFLASYVQAENEQKAIELMWDASEEQWDEMFAALGGAPSAVPPPKSETSESL